MHELIHIIEHSFKDTIVMLPFLYLTYLLMEYIEHKGSTKMKQFLISSRRFGPLIGAVLGLIPHCGFSIMASGFYINKTITLGTLLSVFIATSDEAIPIFISQPDQITTLGNILGLKLIVAIIAGYLIDLLVKNKVLKQEHSIHDVHEHCEEEQKKHPSIYMIALIHTLKVFAFVYIATFILSVLMHTVGEASLSVILQDGSMVQVVIAAMVGLIPNCASSVILSTLYVDQVLSFGSLFAGLISSSGLGILALFKMYDNKKDLIRIILLLLVVAISAGMIIQMIRV